MSATISPYNLSAWALKHQALMLYALRALRLAGCVAYAQLGQKTALLIVSLLMLQLQRFSLMILALLTAPLGIIGVTASLLLFHVPFGFVAMLGMISLAGMIMRNSVILLDQIDQDMGAGATHYDAIVEATVRRFRPMMLTAAAAILAMIPLTRSVFWGCR